MPFRSRAQQGFLFSQHPEIAKRWAKETPKKAYKKLPEHVGSKPRALHKAASVFLESFADELEKTSGLLGKAQLGRVLEGGKALLGSERSALAEKLHVRPEKLEHLLAEAKARRDPTASTHGFARAVTHALNPVAAVARARAGASPEAVKLLREEKHHAGVRRIEKGVAVTGLLGAAAAAHRRAQQIGEQVLAPDPSVAADDPPSDSYAPLFHEMHGLNGT